jgi:hypothetical protein
MMAAMITPRIKPSTFWRRQATADLFVQDQRQAKLGASSPTWQRWTN